MIGLLVVTHGSLSKSLFDTAAMFTSDKEGIEYVCFTDGQGVEDLKERVKDRLKKLEAFDNVVCFVDIPGGSPARVLGELIMDNPKLELISGVNLPLLVEAILSRHNMPIKNLVDYLVNVSRESITNVGSLLRG